MNHIQLLVGPKMNCNDQYSCSLPDDTDRDYFTLERKIGYIDIYPVIYMLALFCVSLTHIITYLPSLSQIYLLQHCSVTVKLEIQLFL